MHSRELPEAAGSDDEVRLAVAPPSGPAPWNADEARALLHAVEIPSEPIPPQAYARYLSDVIVPACANVQSPFCLAHMTTVVPAVLRPIAEVAIQLNQNLVKKEASGILTAVERQAIAALHKLVYDLPAPFYAAHMHRDESTLGIGTAGGSISNITALWIARNVALRPAEAPGVEQAGIKKALDDRGARRAVIVGSTALHYSLRKAAAVLGLGEQGCIQVPTDAEGRVSLPGMREALAESRGRGDVVIAIVGTAGTTDCGSIDPLARLSDLAREFGTHFHVDAAWGGPLLLSRQQRAKLAGIEEADSVAFDGHKLMHLPVASSFLLLRDPSLASAIEKRAHYMLQEHSGDLGARSLEGSRPSASLLMHAALRLIGQSAYEQLIDASVRLAHTMASQVAARTEFELLMAPATNIVLYRYLPAAQRDRAHALELTPADNEAISAFNLALQRQQMESGAGSVSRTRVPYARAGSTMPVTALRAIVSHPDTTEVHVRSVLDEQARIAAALEAAAVPSAS